MDYIPYRRTSRNITIYTTLISVDLAQHEILRVFCDTHKGDTDKFAILARAV